MYVYFATEAEEKENTNTEMTKSKLRTNCFRVNTSCYRCVKQKRINIKTSTVKVTNKIIYSKADFEK